MQEVFDKLRSLQEILSEKFEVEKKIDDIPKALATKIELVNRLKKTYIQKNEELVKTKEKIKSTRQKMYDAEAEREKYERQMDLIKTQREYEALDKEIKDATEREQDFRRELQNEEKMLEEMQENLEKEEVMISKQEEEVKSEQSRIKHEIKEKQKVLAKLEKEETKITPGLDEEILFKFERIIRSKAGLGIVPVIEGVCAGCYMILPPQFVNDVRSSNKIMFCPDCSRILFFQEKIEADYNKDIFQNDQENQGDKDNQEEEDSIEDTSTDDEED
jgi:predicted  nucleic acid-binding Zn-ribbon protein